MKLTGDYKEDVKKVFNYTLKLISIRLRSEKELKDRLLQKQVPLEIIQDVLDSIKEIGYINDENFAREWVENHLNFHQQGILMLKKELKDKGIDEEIVENLLKQYFTPENEEKIAEKVLEQKKYLWKDIDLHSAYQKAQNLLYRRGFSPAVIKKVLNKFFGLINES